MNVYANLEEGGAIHLKNCRLRVKTETACTIVCAFVYPSAYVSTNVSCGWHEEMTGVYVGMDLSTGRIVLAKKCLSALDGFTLQSRRHAYTVIFNTQMFLSCAVKQCVCPSNFLQADSYSAYMWRESQQALRSK